jgi:hypothetical protein
MKRTNANQSGNNEPGLTAFKSSCLASCRKILARIAAAREMIFNESRQTLKMHEHLLRLALNEAEAVAWQTMYPHLVFPALATEKVQAVVAWDKLQSLRRLRVRLGSPARPMTGVF